MLGIKLVLEWICYWWYSTWHTVTTQKVSVFMNEYNFFLKIKLEFSKRVSTKKKELCISTEDKKAVMIQELTESFDHDWSSVCLESVRDEAGKRR